MSKDLSRRDFAKAAALASLGATVAACSSNDPSTTPAQPA
jgi:hypothetical protein